MQISQKEKHLEVRSQQKTEFHLLPYSVPSQSRADSFEKEKCACVFKRVIQLMQKPEKLNRLTPELPLKSASSTLPSARSRAAARLAL